MSYPVRPVTVSASIPAPPDEVFAFISDTRNDPSWNANVSDVRQVEGDGIGVGARFEFVQRVSVGKNVLESEVTVEVVELGERRIVWDIEDRFQTRRVTMEVVSDRQGSKVTQTTEANFKRKPGLTGLLYPMLAKRTFRSQFVELARQF